LSQPELVRALQSARPVAPAELRERVRLVAAQASPPPRRLVTWRRAFAVALPVAAAIAAGVIVARPTHQAAQPAAPPLEADRAAVAGAPATGKAQAPSALQVPSSAARLQHYSASLQLEVKTPAAVSHATKQAVAVARSLGGYVASVNVSSGAASGEAEIRLRIAKPRVEEALRRLSALGRIVTENVQVQDVQAGVDATSRVIARLQHDLAVLRAQEQTPELERRVAALAARIERLQRGVAATARGARYATVDLRVATPQPAPAQPHRHGPFHGLVSAFRWAGIGAIYVLAAALPLLALGALAWLAARAWRRRREEELLSRP
jgi:hypothetical protein